MFAGRSTSVVPDQIARRGPERAERAAEVRRRRTVRAAAVGDRLTRDVRVRQDRNRADVQRRAGRRVLEHDVDVAQVPTVKRGLEVDVGLDLTGQLQRLDAAKRLTEVQQRRVVRVGDAAQLRERHRTRATGRQTKRATKHVREDDVRVEANGHRKLEVHGARLTDEALGTNELRMLLELLEQLVADSPLLLSGVMPLSRGAPGGYAESETGHQEKSQELQDLGSWGHNPSSLNVDTIPCPGHATTTRRRGPSGENGIPGPATPASCKRMVLLPLPGDRARRFTAKRGCRNQRKFSPTSQTLGYSRRWCWGTNPGRGAGSPRCGRRARAARSSRRTRHHGHRATHRPHQPLGRGAWFLARAHSAASARRPPLLAACLAVAWPRPPGAGLHRRRPHHEGEAPDRAPEGRRPTRAGPKSKAQPEGYPYARVHQEGRHPELRHAAAAAPRPHGRPPQPGLRTARAERRLHCPGHRPRRSAASTTPTTSCRPT